MTEAQKVWLSITGTVRDKASQMKDIMEFSTEGNVYREKNSTCVCYDESEISGVEGTTTTVRLEDGKISVIRMGVVNSIMEFEEGRRNVTLYSTPYGDITMGIFTKGVDVAYNEKRDPVKVRVKYSIDVEGVENSQNVLDIKIKNYM
ncbi:MAG: DUF1934 domain-containing protein [Eubacterium sp.]|nr:DUF1934 domain-containing protein [Eubacterium sp.]